MPEIWTMGEMIVEIMREHEGTQLYEPNKFIGPYPSGAPAIFIDTVARMGKSCGIIGGVGNDDFGKCLLDRLKYDGVDCSHVLIDDTTSTGCAFVTYFEDGSRKFIFHIGNTPAAKAKAPSDDVFKGIKYFHIMGCSLMANTEFGSEIVKAMKAAQKQGAKISFDPNIRAELLKNKESIALIDDVLANTSVLMPGVPELLSISGENSIERAVEKCFKNDTLEIIALKNGSKGCRIFTREHEYSMGIYKVDAADATGAGDSFDGAFISGLCDGMEIKDIIRQSTAAAALNTAAFGPMEGKISKSNILKMTEENEECIQTV